MLKERAQFFGNMALVLDLATTMVAYGCAFHLRKYHAGIFPFGAKGFPYAFEDTSWIILIILPTWFFTLRMFRVHHSHRTTSVLPYIRVFVKAVAMGIIFLVTVSYLLDPTFVSRLFIAIFAVLNVAFLIMERLALVALLRHFRRQGYNYRNILIVGTTEKAASFVRAIERHAEWGYRILGFLTEQADLVGETFCGRPVLGPVERLQEHIIEEVADEVVLAPEKASMETIEKCVRCCELFGIKSVLLAELFETKIATVKLDELDGIPLLSFETIPMRGVDQFSKRAFDLTVSVFGILFFAPVMVAVVFYLLLREGRPVTFSQVRCGLNGRQFKLYKFRTMVTDAEAIKPRLKEMNEQSGPVFKIRNDPRITPVGRFLRRWSLDELPQLVNVVKGDMSIIGPRPALPEEVKAYEPWQMRRLSVKPGMTGIWQTSGRSEVSFDRWIKMDLEYIDNWSVRLDIRIFLKTIPAVLGRRGAV